MENRLTYKVQKLISVAIDSKRLLEETTNKLHKDGQYEAILFYSLLIITSPDFQTLKDSKVLVWDYLVLLSNVLSEKFPDENKRENFIEERLRFYAKEWDKIKDGQQDAVIAIYSLFYLNPLTDNNEFHTSCIDIHEFQNALNITTAWLFFHVKESVKTFNY